MFVDLNYIELGWFSIRLLQTRIFSSPIAIFWQRGESLGVADFCMLTGDREIPGERASDHAVHMSFHEFINTCFGEHGVHVG